LNRFHRDFSVAHSVSERRVDVRSSELESVDLTFGEFAS
jgi:hypothetical protein